MDMNKKAIYYTIDAILASVLITGALALIIINPFYDSSYSSKNYISQDMLTALSNIKISELNDPFITAEINSLSIDNPEISVLEQIGKYWALDYGGKAETLSGIVLSSLNISGKQITLKIGNESIYSLGEGRNEVDTAVSRRMIAGIDKGKPLAGTSASAYLRRIHDKKTSAYYYFGGFIGQGMVSFFIDDLPEDINSSGNSRVDNLYLEGDFQGDFLFFINGETCERIPGNATFNVNDATLQVDVWELPNCTDFIESGRNNFKIEFIEDIESSSVSGGFLRIDYRTDELQQETSYGSETYNFPGVEGIANIYDSFFIPGLLEEMNIYLHFKTNQTAYISIGERILLMNTQDEFDILENVTYEKNDTEFKVWIDDDYLLNEANFDYSQISVNTVPIRFAAYDITTEIFEGGNADIVVITDFSGSMMKSVSSWADQGFGVKDCETLYGHEDARKTHLARCLDNELVEIVLNYTGNRVWPVFYHNNDVSWYNNPEDKTAVKSYISNFGPQGKGKTCIACAINQAYDILNAYSGNNRSKFVVLMSDGSPTHCAQGSCISTSIEYGVEQCVGYCDTSGMGGCQDDEMIGCNLSDDSCLGAEENTISSTQRLVDDLNVTIFTIGFGLISECDRANNLLNQTATIGNGTYQHSSNVSELLNIYEEISYEILTRIDQINQSVSVQGNITLSTLYNDSKIDFTYEPIEDMPNPGKISLVFEGDLDNPSCTNTVELYPDIEIINAEVTSYSGPHWTDEVIINGVSAFNLSDYYVPYVRLGDPFSVRIPVDLLNPGTNSITINTGDSAENNSGCSIDNKFVYTALLPSVTERTDAMEFAEGCNWTVQTITGSTLNLNIPEEYIGGKECFYDPSFDYGDYTSTDAYDSAMLNLLDQLDPLNEGHIIVDLDESDLEISLTIVGGIPYMWGPSIAEIEVIS